MLTKLKLFLYAFFLLASWDHLYPQVKAEQFNNQFCYFIPPSDWNIVKKKHLSKQVKVGFIGQREKGFNPSINLAVEKLPHKMNLKKYVAIVKKLHHSDKNCQWRDLGPFQSQAGKGRLTELTRKEKGGVIRMFQYIHVDQKYAYILTAAILKDSFKKFVPTFLSTFRSFTLTTNLINAIPNSYNRELLQKALDNLQACKNLDKDTQKKGWNDVQSIILHDLKDMGQHWQVLMAKYAQEKYLSSS